MADSELQFVTLLTSHQGRLFAYVLSLVGDADQSPRCHAGDECSVMAEIRRLRDRYEFLGVDDEDRVLSGHGSSKRISRDRLVFDDLLTAVLRRVAEHRNENVERRQDMLRDCLTQLSDRQRELIAARYQDGFELAVIAESMNRTTNAIKQALFRARKALVDCVCEKMQEIVT